MLFDYETSRLRLKVVHADAADAVLDFYLRDRELFEKYEPDRMPNFYTLQYQRQMLLFEYNMSVQGKLFRFYVYERNNSSRIIGTICVHNINRGYTGSCEVGYKFSSEVHRRGYASEALSSVMQLVFSDLKIHRAMAWVLPDNMASIRLLERVGFIREGISRGYLMLHGVWTDHVQYSMLDSDASMFYSAESGHIQ